MPPDNSLHILRYDEVIKTSQVFPAVEERRQTETLKGNAKMYVQLEIRFALQSKN